jgi:hypothetical protein
MISIDQLNKDTIAAFADPQIGDRFEEFSTFWLIVVNVDEEGISTWQKPGNSNPFLKQYASAQEFRDAFSFNGRSNYWIKLFSKNYDVSDLLKE